MKRVIAIIWPFSSWKDHAGDFLARTYKLQHMWISSSLRMICDKEWLTQSRENLAIVWKRVAKNFGDSYLAKVLLENTHATDLVISWPRQKGQLEYLRENTSCLFIWIQVDQKIRYDRMLSRWKIDETMSFMEFQEADKLEQSSVQNVDRCLKLCDVIIENNGSIKDFEEKILFVTKDFLWKNQNISE